MTENPSNTAYIALGSNLDNPKQQIQQAFIALNQIPDTQLIKGSSLYQSKAVGPGSQPDYINAVAELVTHLTPQQLLTELQKVELQQGRQRSDERWIARTLDLDLLLYNQEVIATETLTVPHYAMTERNFVLYPLAEINESLVFPDGNSLTELLSCCSKDNLYKLG